MGRCFFSNILFKQKAFERVKTFAPIADFTLVSFCNVCARFSGEA